MSAGCCVASLENDAPAFALRFLNIAYCSIGNVVEAALLFCHIKKIVLFLFSFATSGYHER